MAFGDPRSFSKLGMSLEEVRKKETENRGFAREASRLSGMTRTARRGYKDAMRAGKPQLALDIMNEANKEGVNVEAPQPRRSDLIGEIEARDQRMKAQLNQTDDGLNPDRLLSFEEKDKKVRDEAIAARGPGPLSGRMQFAEDLKRSALIQSGDPNARDLAYKRGEKLGISREQTRGFLEKNIDGYSGGTDLDSDRSKEDSLIKASNPMNAASAAISSSLSGFGGSDLYRGLDSGDPRTNASGLLLGMAGKMGLQGKAAADWISSMRDIGGQKTRQSVLTAKINSMQDGGNFMETSVRQQEELKLRERVDSLTNSTLDKFGKKKPNKLDDQMSGLMALVGKY